MYIDLKIIYFILATLGCIALIYIIITLSNLNKLIKNSNELVIDNKNNIRNSLLKLPEVISNFKPNLSDIFFDKYSPIPVAFALFLFEPVNPFSNTLDKSDAFIPQPLSSITSNIFVPLS